MSMIFVNPVSMLYGSKTVILAYNSLFNISDVLISGCSQMNTEANLIVKSNKK